MTHTVLGVILLLIVLFYGPFQTLSLCHKCMEQNEKLVIIFTRDFAALYYVVGLSGIGSMNMMT